MSAEDGLEVRCHARRDGVVVHCRGELDIASADMLREALRDTDTQVPTVVLDLREVTFIDSAGVSALVGEHNRARTRGFRLALAVGGAPRIERVIALSGLKGVLELVEVPEEVLREGVNGAGDG